MKQDVTVKNRIQVFQASFQKLVGEKQDVVTRQFFSFYL